MKQCVCRSKTVKNAYLSGTFSEFGYWRYTIVEDKLIYAPVYVWKSIASCKRFIKNHGIGDLVEAVSVDKYLAEEVSGELNKNLEEMKGGEEDV